jgi:hypothetical protein
MTTQSWSTRVRHDSDATFREWGLELSTKLAAAGLVQTADTGQINWTTVTRPGASTEAGFEVWRMNDALQATAPVFFRIGYGTNSGTTGPRIQVTVGTGTDGAGTLTGTALTTIRSIHSNAAQATDTPRQSYLCVNEGFFGLNWKVGAGQTEGSFFFNRTCDSAGDPTATGGIVIWGTGSAGAFTATQALRFAATAAAYTAQTVIGSTALGICPQTPAATVVGSDIQAMMGWTITPRIAPLFGLCGVLDAEVTTGNTFTTTLVGSTPRTYIGLSTAAGPFGAGNASNPGQPKVAMLWE